MKRKRRDLDVGSFARGLVRNAAGACPKCGTTEPVHECAKLGGAAVRLLTREEADRIIARAHPDQRAFVARSLAGV